MHARLEDLISLRDQQPVDAASAAHVAACGQCRAQLERLASVRVALASLAPLEPPAQAWARIARQLAAAPQVATRRAPRRAWVRWPGGAALVATFAVAMLAALLVATPWRRAVPQSEPAVASSAQAGTAEAAPLATLVARSQQLEASLHALPQRPAIEVAANSAAIDALQARIQWLDTQLVASTAGVAPAELPPERTRELWQTRVQLLNSLVGVRYAEAVHARYPSGSGSGDI
jgi:hypothetical protein